MKNASGTTHDRAETRAAFLRAVLALDRADGKWPAGAARDERRPDALRDGDVAAVRGTPGLPDHGGGTRADGRHP